MRQVKIFKWLILFTLTLGIFYSCGEDSVTEVIEKAEEIPSAPVSSTSSSSRHQSSSSYDNMRGFDPASEDDTDDNGMSRYMENDDDEGWD